MTLHRSPSSRVRQAAVTMPVLAGLLVAASQAGALPLPQADTPLSVIEAVASRASVGRADRALFTWTGRVDREVLIVVRGRDVRTRGFDASLPNRARVTSALPRNSGSVLVRLNDGRGDVDVIEQPSARNGYQAVLRVRDPRGGADNYRITAYWDDRNGYDDRYDRRDRDDVYDRRDNDRGKIGHGGGWGRGGNTQYGGGGSLNWSGRVDDVVEIQIAGRRADAITRSGIRVSDVNSNMRGGGLPNRNVNLRIDQRSGRGSIAVVQQPSSWNGYTAIIRINDSRSGAAYYDFTAYWE
jgi:hypothetical protein